MTVMPSGKVDNRQPIQRCIQGPCRATFAINDRLYVCSHCGGLLEVELDVTEDAATLKRRWRDRLASFGPHDRSGVWRFRELLPFSDDAPVVSLNEGNTPLYRAPKSARYCGLEHLLLKHQGANPTGSFKDTGMTTAVTQACLLGAKLVICASTGNTAASLAAYAARADICCAIMVPEGQVSHAKLAQALDYGAFVLEMEGNFDASMRVVRELAQDEAIYLVNSINPFRIEGQKTVAVELCEQLDWQIPDHLVLPGGNLGNSSAFGKGFYELLHLELINDLPKMTVVQAEGAAPFAHLFEKHEGDLLRPNAGLDFEDVAEPKTLASAIKIGAPVSWTKAWRALAILNGRVVTVTEQEIADAKAILGREGIGCEPASATTIAGIRKLVADDLIHEDESVVAVLTGHLLKDTDYVINYHRGTLNFDGKGSENIKGSFTNQPIKVKSDVKQIRDVLMRLTDSREGS